MFDFILPLLGIKTFSIFGFKMRNSLRMRKTFPTIQTAKFTLRQFVDSDLENVFLGLSDPAIIKYYGVNYTSLAATKAQMQWFKELEDTKTGIWWAIVSKDGAMFYGGIGLNNWSEMHRKAEIGFWLLPAHWGKGLMQEAVALVCDYAFNTANLHRVEAIVESANENCKKLMDKLHFEYEGTMRDCEIKNGNFISLATYAKFHQPS